MAVQQGGGRGEADWNVLGAAGAGSDAGTQQHPPRAPRRAREPPTHPGADKGIIPPLFAMPLEELQPLISRRLKW